MAGASSSDMYGLVDMGSNGIRFSITDLTPQTSRALPVVFQERLGISLYDAQFSSSGSSSENVKGPIPRPTIDRVLAGLKRFKGVCADFGVAEANVRVLATEATRTAVNSKDFLRQIKDVLGWEVELLPKEVEGRIGAMGIASSFDSVSGIVMDLGGGSTQLTWMICENGRVQLSPKGSISFPYGAAAMVQLLSTIDSGKHAKKARAELRTKIKQEYTDALDSLELPDILQQKAETEGLTLYLSGGGFRGWGYLLMSQHKGRRKGPYPIPIINGYCASVKEFGDVESMTALVQDRDDNDTDIFRVSNRRASQVPAVAFLVDAITSAFPFITHVRFCQGGVREGYLFDTLSESVRARSPLASATSRHAHSAESSESFAELLRSSFPPSTDGCLPSSVSSPSLLCATADTMWVQSNAPKETASLSALHLPITGVLASSHGISHADRALLALILSRRWNGDLPPPHTDLKERLQSILEPSEVWWAEYVGAVAALVGVVYPAGRIRVENDRKRRIGFEAKWMDGLGKKGNLLGIKLTAKVRDDDGGGILGRELVEDFVKGIEKVGKKKNWIRGGSGDSDGDGFGFPVDVDVEWV